MQIGGNTIIRLRKEKDQLIEENKLIKEMIGHKLDETIVQERAIKAIKIKNESDNKLLLEELHTKKRMSKLLTK